MVQRVDDAEGVVVERVDEVENIASIAKHLIVISGAPTNVGGLAPEGVGE